MTQADPAALWHQMREHLLAFVTRRIDVPADAEDIVQEVFLKMHQRIDGLRQRERLEAWVYQITRNAIIDHHRRSAVIARTRAQVATDRSLHLEADEADEAEESALLAQYRAGCPQGGPRGAAARPLPLMPRPWSSLVSSCWRGETVSGRCLFVRGA